MTASEDTTEASGDQVGSKATTPTSNSEENLASVTEGTEPEVDDKKETTEPLQPDDEAEDLEAVSESEPLRSAEEGTSKDAEAATADGKIMRDEEEGIGDADSQGSADQSPRKHKYDVRCIVVGVLVLVVVVAGATAAVLAHRFKSTPTYEFQFASYYGDHMILQRAPYKAVVWGYGPIITENTTVIITVAGENSVMEFSTTVKNTVSGPVWQAALDPIGEPGPFTITATLDAEGDRKAVLEDVLFGDVWVCAGQSTMLSLDEVANDTADQEQASQLDNLRLFALTPHKSNVPRYHLQHVQMLWTSAGGIDHSYRAYFPELCLTYGKKLYEKLQYPVGLVAMTYSDSLIEEWAPPNVLKDCDVTVRDSSSSVWNAMVNPVLKMSIYGMMWYQGELDAIHQALSQRFNCTFVHLVNEWRSEVYISSQGSTDPNFPVGFVQLPPNTTSEHPAYSYTTIRWQQMASYGYVPNQLQRKMFMAASIDLPEAGHGSNIEDLADRLVLGALSEAYSQRKAQYQGPYPLHYVSSAANHQITITFNSSHVDRRNNDGFEVCCSENRDVRCLASYTKTPFAPGREWISVPITHHTSSSITLSWQKCADKHVVGLRYAWRDTPCKWKKCAVYESQAGLPMSPYIYTDLMTSDDQPHKFPEHQVFLGIQNIQVTATTSDSGDNLDTYF